MPRKLSCPKKFLVTLLFNTSPLEGGCTNDPLPKRSPQNSLEFSLEFWFLLTKRPYKHLGLLKFKSCGNEYSLLIHFRPV